MGTGRELRRPQARKTGEMYPQQVSKPGSRQARQRRTHTGQLLRLCLGRCYIFNVPAMLRNGVGGGEKWCVTLRAPGGGRPVGSGGGES